MNGDLQVLYTCNDGLVCEKLWWFVRLVFFCLRLALMWPYVHNTENCGQPLVFALAFFRLPNAMIDFPTLFFNSCDLKNK